MCKQAKVFSIYMSRRWAASLAHATRAAEHTPSRLLLHASTAWLSSDAHLGRLASGPARALLRLLGLGRAGLLHAAVQRSVLRLQLQVQASVSLFMVEQTHLSHSRQLLGLGRAGFLHPAVQRSFLRLHLWVQASVSFSKAAEKAGHICCGCWA